LPEDIKEKLLILNRARVYRINLQTTTTMDENNDLSWARQLFEDYEEHGDDRLR
jgi:hypothetical protein